MFLGRVSYGELNYYCEHACMRPQAASVTSHRASASELVLLVILWRWDLLPPSYKREPDPSLKIIISVPALF